MGWMGVNFSTDQHTAYGKETGGERGDNGFEPVLYPKCLVLRTLSVRRECEGDGEVELKWVVLIWVYGIWVIGDGVLRRKGDSQGRETERHRDGKTGYGVVSTRVMRRGSGPMTTTFYSEYTTTYRRFRQHISKKKSARIRTIASPNTVPLRDKA